MIHAHRTRTTAPRRRPTARAGAGLIARAGTGLIALTVLAGACGFGGGDEDASSDDNCTRVPAAVSSEKIQLMTELGTAWIPPMLEQFDRFLAQIRDTGRIGELRFRRASLD